MVRMARDTDRTVSRNATLRSGLLSSPSLTGIMTNDELAECAKRYAEAWCSQDPEKVAAFFAERGSISINNGPPAVGRAAIAREAEAYMTTFPDMVVTMDQVVQDEEGTKFHWTLVGTNTGPGGTGKRVRISGY